MSVQQPIKNAANKYIDGLQLSWVDANNLSLAAGSCRNSSNVNDIELDAAVNIDATIVGANGIDAGALANSSFYAVYVIADSSKYRSTAGLLSLASNAAPSLPYGYDMYRRVGYVLTSGAAAMLNFHQHGNDKNRKMFYDAPISVLAAGAADSRTAVSLGAAVPNNIDSPVWLRAEYTTADLTRLANVAAYGSTANTVQIRNQVVAVAAVSQIVVPTALNSNVVSISYNVDNAADSLSLSVQGYEDILA